MKKQIELLKKYGITNYSVGEDGKITINGSLYLDALKTCDKDFLKETIINGFLDLDALKTCDKDFLKGTTINGYLDLRSLETCDKDFLKGTTINGYLDLRSLETCDKDILRQNVKQLKIGYNKDWKYCFFDGILSRVDSVTNKKDYTIYTIPFGYIAQKGKFTAHGKTVKKAIVDLEFKIVAEKLKNEPIDKDTELTVKYYRLLTGACDQGIRQWMQQNEIPFKIVDKETVETKPIKAVDLLPILEKTNAYGLDKVKSLINF